MRIGWLVLQTISKGGCRYEMVCIYQPPNARMCELSDFGKQPNGGGAMKKGVISSSMFLRSYAPWVLYSPGSMFLGFYVPQFLHSITEVLNYPKL
jgi:hypothetical protein